MLPAVTIASRTFAILRMTQRIVGGALATLTADGQYIDLALNPERFTGYAGESANKVWRAIYEENCFGLSEASLESGKIASAGISSSSSNPFGRLSEGLGTEMIKADDTDMCEEKRVYYRVISGE